MDYPPPRGGIQEFTYNLEQGLKVLGHEVRLLNFDGNNINIYKKLKFRDFLFTRPTLHSYFINPFYIFRPSSFRNFVYLNLVYRESRIEIGKFHPDIIHLTKPNLYPSVYDSKLPFLVTCHSEEVRNIYPVKYSLQHASQIHCVSNYTKNKVLKITPDRKNDVKVIYNAVDVAQLSMDKRTVKKNHVIKNQVITICRLVKRKNVENIISAFSLLPHSILKDYQYIIAGDGPERKNLELMVKNLHLEENVIFKGWVSDTEKIELLSGSDLFIMCPTTYKNEDEGFGISFIEAQALGVPVIGSKNGGSPEAIGDGGILVENELDPGEIAKSIELLLTDKELYGQLVQNIQKRIGQFDSKNHILEIEKLYKEILEE
jgi:glycosyltransferase involved in cell wall biosynthesis